MTSQQILQSDLLDILFEKRNKLYGAYALRQAYRSQLIKAVGITALLVIALLFFGNTASTKTILVDEKEKGYTTHDVVIPQKPEPPKPTPPAAPQPPVKQDVLLDKIKVVEKPTTPIATQRDLDEAVPGNTKVDGPPVTTPLPVPLATETGGIGTAEKEPEKSDPPLPNRQPQFPGGADAWLKFLSRNLMPPTDLEAGEKRSVLVRFSVDEEGVVTAFRVVQSGGADFDNEVIRVLKKMPRWLPAIQAGRAVSVSFTQPVMFQAAE